MATFVSALEQLADSPTKETMYEAQQKLYHMPVPLSQLNRVELYIKKYKMQEVRHFSERHFEAEFNRKYTQWFREVVIHDMDVKISEKQAEIQSFMDTQHTTDNDRRRDEDISSGMTFNNKFGQKIYPSDLKMPDS
jgi:hypothetical protein